MKNKRLGRLTIALGFATALSGASMTPALGRDNDGDHDKGWHKGQQRSERKEHGDRDSYSGYYRDRRDPYYYSAPVYVPPPVYYAPRYYEPQPAPGITLFFPLEFRR